MSRALPDAAVLWQEPRLTGSSRNGYRRNKQAEWIDAIALPTERISLNRVQSVSLAGEPADATLLTQNPRTKIFSNSWGLMYIIVIGEVSVASGFQLSLRRQKLEQDWFTRLKDAEAMWLSACRKYERACESKGDVDPAYTAKVDAEAEYRRVLRIFTDLVLDRKAPPEKA